MHRRRQPLLMLTLLLVAATPVLAAAAPTTQRSADPLNGVPTYGSALVRMVLVLSAIVLGLLIAAKVIPRLLPGLVGKYSPRAGDRLIKVLDMQALDRSHRLFVVSVESQRFLIASSEKGVALLSVLPQAGATSTADAAASDPAQDRSFSDLLSATSPTPLR